jgi:signal transduction histidine kinase
LQIDYTALSFVVPQKVRFRYKLDGHDASWQDPGTRRQAFYSDLRPGQYQFRVIASNNDGVWNEAGSILNFSVAPAWYQTNLFTILCVITAALVLWTLFRLRVRQMAGAMNARFDERLAERTRLARELHDTFLQTIQGSKLIAEDALEHPSDYARMHQAMDRLSAWLAQATEEGRAVLNSLRASTTQGNDLVEGLQRATEACISSASMKVAFSAIGDAREMHPIVRDEVYRIGYEAIRNACVHSGADRLEVELVYAEDLTLRVADNGKGIDAQITAKGKEGHFGLQGMRERAARIGGKLMLDTSATSGTTISLVVPGGIIFRKPAVTPLHKLSRLFSFKRRSSDLD